MEHYNAIIAAVDRSLKRLKKDNVVDYRPLFLKSGGKPAHDAVRSWVRGFGKAMALVPETWSALAEDKRAQVLLEPFLGFFDLAHHAPTVVPDAPSLDEDAALIPRVILVLRMLAQMRSAATPERRSKVGRNEPCPCGSGKNTSSAAAKTDCQSPSPVGVSHRLPPFGDTPSTTVRDSAAPEWARAGT